MTPIEAIRGLVKDKNLLKRLEALLANRREGERVTIWKDATRSGPPARDRHADRWLIGVGEKPARGAVVLGNQDLAVALADKLRDLFPIEVLPS